MKLQDLKAARKIMKDMTFTTLEVDPTDLRPADIVIAVSDHDISGCHCDVKVTVHRVSMKEQS